MNGCLTETQIISNHLKCNIHSYLKQDSLPLIWNQRVLSWGFKSDRILKLQKRAVRIITCNKYKVHTETLLKMQNLLKIEYIMKRKSSEVYYRYKRNELPKYFEPMFVHTILDIILFYITNKDKHWAVMYQTIYTRTTYQNTWMYNWKARYSFIQCFFQSIWKITWFRIIMKIV